MKNLGWLQNLPVVLVLGGDDCMEPIEKTVQAVDLVSFDLMRAIIAGRNHSLKMRLEKADFKTLIRIHRFVDNMPDLMNAADVIITKAVPGTISESFVAGLPIILNSHMPGQEDGNIDYVVSKGSGVWAPHPEDVVSFLCQWLANPYERQKFARISKSLARPYASKDITGKIIGFVKQTQI
jgi:1,2-diacylglycerol 3-beta-galactosyltransferase